MSKRGKIIALILFILIVFEVGVQVGIPKGRMLEREEFEQQLAQKKYDLHKELRQWLEELEKRKQEQEQVEQEKKEVKI